MPEVLDGEDLKLSDVDNWQPPKEVLVHPQAIVEQGAELGKGVTIGPYCHIGPRVKIHDGARLLSHVIVSGRTTIGEKSIIYPFATLGSVPQDLKYSGEDGGLILGPENSVRQYVNMSIGTDDGGLLTKIGARNLFMVYAHVGHDSHVGNNCVFVNGVSLGGHVAIADYSIVGGHSAVHQFCKLGLRSFVAGGAMVVQDVPPYCMVHGNRAVINGLNVVGLKRSGISAEEIKGIKSMYRLLYKENLTVEDCIKTILRDVENSKSRDIFVNFLRKSERGVCR
jgi:UDP-N-acetylglucosamine acyltransferase